MTPTAVTVPPSVPTGDDTVAISRWQVPDRHLQRAAADEMMAGRRRSRESTGAGWAACLLSTDGRIVTLYERCVVDPDGRGGIAGAAVQGLIAPTAGVAHLDTVVSRVTGGPVARPDDGPFPGCVVLVTIETDGPGRQWQAVARIAAFEADVDPGAIGGHILLSLDGTRVTLYAEWTSEEAHREATAEPRFGGRGGIFDGVPGIRGLSVHRYQLYRFAVTTSCRTWP